MNIKPILDSTQIALEKQAADRFGAAVEDFTRGTLGPLLGVPAPLPGIQVPANRGDGSFYATSYAHALAGGTSYRPKLKFLFKVEFVFTAEAVREFPQVLGGKHSQEFTFLVRSIDRPKIDFEYEDDVNMYNFRTKVLKKIRHRELTITFIDDVGNRVLRFFRALMMLHSPITRRQLTREGNTYPPDPLSVTGGHGMMFEELSTGSLKDTAIRGVVNSSLGNVISTIRVKQLYVDPQVTLGGAVKEVIFDFINARLVSFDLDDLTHETSDVNLMTLQFDYDWMEVVEVGALGVVDGPEYNITVPGVSGAPVDISPHGMLPPSEQGSGNPFLNIITNQLGRGLQQLTSEAVSRGVASIAGKGRFAGLLGSHAAPILGGVVGAAGRDLMSGLGRNVINQAIARPTVMDTAQGGPSPVVAVTPSRESVIPAPQLSTPPYIPEYDADDRGRLVTTNGVTRWVTD